MKNVVLFSMLLLFACAFFSQESLAQIDEPPRAPDGALARLGNGDIGSGDQAVAYSPSGTRLAVATSVGIRLYNARTYVEVAFLTGHTGVVTSVSFSPDGLTLASAGDDETVRLWNVASSHQKAVLTGHTGAVTSVSFSPDGLTLASAGDDRTVRLWDTVSGQEKSILIGHAKAVYSVSFSPDGRTLASSSGDGSILLWDVTLEVSDATAPVPGFCSLTQEVRESILNQAMPQAEVMDCSSVTLGHLAKIRSLNLDLSLFKQSMFSGFSGLQKLDIGISDLTSLPEDVFAGLSELQILSIRGSQLTSLPEGVFAGLTSLQFLDLSGSQLTSLPEGVFAGLTSLQFLDLGDNQLTSLPEGVFTGLSELQILSLDGNLLTSLPENVFSLNKLSQLELYGNPLSDPLPPELGKLANLYWLDDNEPREAGQMGAVVRNHLGDGREETYFKFLLNYCGICPREYAHNYWSSNFSNEFLEEGESCSYAPVNLVDGNPKTGWAEGIKGYGIGAEVVVPAYSDPLHYFVATDAEGGELWAWGKPLDLSKPVRIWAGYGKSPGLFAANGRPKRIGVAVIRLRRAEPGPHDATGCSYDEYVEPLAVAAHEVTLRDFNGFQPLPIPEFRVEHYLQYPMEWLVMDGTEIGIHRRAVNAGQAEPFRQKLTEYTYLLKLTLLDVYTGSRYEDTVISEVGNVP